MSEILGVEILNKAIEERQLYYTKLLNTLHDVYIHLGFTPDPRFIEALQLRKAVEGMDSEEYKMMRQFDEFVISGYAKFLLDVIKENKARVSPLDSLRLKLFVEENKGIDDYGNIVYKCKDCETDQVDDVTGVRIVKNKLGMIVKEE